MNKPCVAFQHIQKVSNDPRNDISIDDLCTLHNVSRSGYYSWIAHEDARQAREAKDQADFALILEAYLRCGRKKGAKGIQMNLLQRENGPVVMNLKKIRRLMNKYNLVCPIRKANPYRRMAKAIRTNNIADNLVSRNFEKFEEKNKIYSLP